MVEFIQFPFAFTKDGKRINIKEVEGSVRVGATIEEIEGKYKVTQALMIANALAVFVQLDN